MIVKKKARPEFFAGLLSWEKAFELRLADFGLRTGDVMVLEEYDPKSGYTGRRVERECRSVMKVNPMDFYKPEEIRKHGLYVIGL